MLDKRKKIIVDIVKDKVSDKMYYTFIMYFISGNLMRFEIKTVIHANIFKE
jgi:hypothetical protein